MSWREDYQKKLITADEAAAKIQDGDRMWYGAIMSAPLDIGMAIDRRLETMKDVVAFSGLCLYPYKWMTSAGIGHIHYETLFLGPVERKLYPMGNITITSYNFCQCDNLARDIMKTNIAIFEVSPPDENGYMSFGPIGSYNGYGIASVSDTVIVQVNKHTPYIPGARDAFLHVSEVDWIVEGDHPLPELPASEITDEDRAIGNFIAAEIPDGACLQVGLGGVPDAVCYQLKDRKDLGFHAEMMPDGVAELVKLGVINNAKKNLHPGKIVTPMTPGSHKLNDFVANNDMMEIHGISYVNNPIIAAQNDNLMCINGTLMCDLTGQCCSESIGHTQFSGTGGQLDYAIAASLSKGGKNFMCLHSTVTNKDGSLSSTITCDLPAGAVVTTPRSLADYIVTEYGIAHLRNKSIPARVNAMIEIAHPDFREQLRKDAIAAGLIRE